MEGDGEYVAVIMSGKVSDIDLEQWAETVGATVYPRSSESPSACGPVGEGEQ